MSKTLEINPALHGARFSFPNSETLSHKLTWSDYFEILKSDEAFQSAPTGSLSPPILINRPKPPYGERAGVRGIPCLPLSRFSA